MRRRPGRRIGCLPLPLALLVVAGLAVAAVAVRTGCPAPPDVAAGAPGAAPAAAGLPAEAVRAEDSTYLTFPEWYIVYSAQEYAAALAPARPSAFPYFRSIGQYWCSYNTVFEWARRRYPFSAGNHLMLVVIGTSYTAEYAGKGAYENTLGRVTEWLAGAETEEDAFAREVARDYGAFLVHTPWYKFPFSARLAALWQRTSLWGSQPVRKWERKLVLSGEYGIKAAYGWLIGRAVAVYGPAPERTLALVDDLPELGQGQEIEIEVVRQGSPHVVALPRYREFTRTVLGLIRAGGTFVAFAGNDEIMLTAIAPRDWGYALPDGQPLFEQVILTEPERKRVAVNAPVRALHRIVQGLEAQGVRIEHLYDY
jgi:hypothetical protein